MFDCSGVLKKVVDCGDHVAVIIESDGETRRFRGDFPKVAHCCLFRLEPRVSES